MSARRKIRSKYRKKIKKKIREQFWLEDNPNKNLDYIEVPLPSREYNKDGNSLDAPVDEQGKHHQNFDEFIFEYAERYLKQKNRPYGDLLKDKRRIEKIRYKMDKAAALYFTDMQFKIYVSYYKLGLKTKEIATQMGKTQGFISHCLRLIRQKFPVLFRLNKKEHQYTPRFDKDKLKPPKPPEVPKDKK